MTQNAIDQIKEAEAAAKEKIEQTKHSTDQLIANAQAQGERVLESTEKHVSPQIEALLETAKKQMQTLKTKKERELDQALKKISAIDDRAINDAAKIILNTILKKIK